MQKYFLVGDNPVCLKQVGNGLRIEGWDVDKKAIAPMPELVTHILLGLDHDSSPADVREIDAQAYHAALAKLKGGE